MFKCVIPCYIKTMWFGILESAFTAWNLTNWAANRHHFIQENRRMARLCLLWRKPKIYSNSFLCISGPDEEGFVFLLSSLSAVHPLHKRSGSHSKKGLWRSSLRRATYWTMKQTNPVLSGFQAKFEYDVGWSLTKWSRFCSQRNFN